LPATTAVFAEFRANLTTLSDKIQALNEVRPWKFHGFEPRRMLSSVSI
jgi:hypothetical protein